MLVRVRNSERLEYIRQPHVILLIVAVILVVGTAMYLAVTRLQDRSRRASLPANQACAELVKDEELCRFAAVSESNSGHGYKSISTEVDATNTTITTTEFENSNRMASYLFVNGKEEAAYILLEADSYIRDYTDNTWAHLHDTEYEPMEIASHIKKYDFTSETSADVIDFRDNYELVNQEPCENRTCLKYKVTMPEDPSTQIFIWFDTEQYLIRRYQTISETLTTNTEYSYGAFTINTPAPIKEVDVETFNSLLE